MFDFLILNKIKRKYHI